MKPRVAFVMVLCAVGSTFASTAIAQGFNVAEAVAPDIPGVVKGHTRIQMIADNLPGTEGPIGAPDGSLLLTETSANRITRIDNGGKLSIYLENSNYSHGLAYDAKGRLISAERGAPAAGPGRMGGKPQLGVAAPTRDVLVDNFEGRPLIFMNDLAADRKGGIYFTDSGDPVNPAHGIDGPRKGHGIYYLRSDGAVIKLTGVDQITFPSGIILSPDEKTLYLNDLNQEEIWAYDVASDGHIGNRKVFGRLKGQPGLSPRADGMAVDTAGRIYVTSTYGIQVFSPQGENLGTISISPRPQNITFGGADRKVLYAVGMGKAYKIHMLSQGLTDRAK